MADEIEIECPSCGGELRREIDTEGTTYQCWDHTCMESFSPEEILWTEKGIQPDREILPPIHDIKPRPRLVILESPFAGNVAMNVEYARLCVAHSLTMGEAPIASHLLYTQAGILDDTIPEQRKLGIDAGLAWKAVAEGSVVYTDLGITSGMKYGMEQAEEAGLPIDQRKLF